MLDSGKSPVVVSSKLNREQQQQQQTKTVRVVRLQTISSELLKKNGRSRNRTFLFLLFFNELKKFRRHQKIRTRSIVLLSVGQDKKQERNFWPDQPIFLFSFLALLSQLCNKQNNEIFSLSVYLQILSSSS